MALSGRQTGIIFFIFTVVLSVLIVIWMVLINKGSVTFTGNPPYFIKIPGVKDKLCEEEKCSVSVAPNNYTVNVSKLGYYDENIDLEIERWKDVEYQVTFNFIPVLEETTLGMPYALPEGYEEFLNELDSISLTAFGEIEKDLDFLPANPKVVSFSPKGNYLYVETSGKSSIYNLETEEEIKVIVPKGSEPVWSPDGNLFAYIAINKENQNQTLYLHNADENETEIVTSFLRDFDDYKMYFSNDSQKAVVVDLESDPNEIFLVDIEGKSKEVLFVLPGFQELKWSADNNFFVYSNIVDSIFSTYLYDIENDNSNTITVNFDLDKVDFYTNNKIIFISNTSYEGVPEGEVQIGFEEAFEMFQEVVTEGPATPETETEVEEGKPVYFIEYDTENKEFTDISTIGANQRIAVERIEMSEDRKSIYFWTGVNLYRVKLRE